MAGVDGNADVDTARVELNSLSCSRSMASAAPPGRRQPRAGGAGAGQCGSGRGAREEWFLRWQDAKRLDSRVSG